MHPTRLVHRLAPAALLLTALCLGCGTSRATMKLGASTVVTLTVDYANVYLLPASDGKLLLIDGGFPKNIDKLEAEITRAGYAPAQVSAMVVTHGHYDHAGAARHFQQKYGTKILAGRGDEAMLASGKHEPLCATSFVARRRLEDDQKGTFEPVTPDVWIDAPTPLSSVIAIDGDVQPLPGHTRGSVVVRVGEATFVGDLLRGGIVGSGAEVHFYMCDLEANRRDVRRLLDELTPKGSWYFPGHFGPLTRQAVDEKFRP